MRDGRAVTSRFTEVSGDSMPSLFVHEAYTQISWQQAAGGGAVKGNSVGHLHYREFFLLMFSALICPHCLHPSGQVIAPGTPRFKFSSLNCTCFREKLQFGLLLKVSPRSQAEGQLPECSP